MRPRLAVAVGGVLLFAAGVAAAQEWESTVQAPREGGSDEGPSAGDVSSGAGEPAVPGEGGAPGAKVLPDDAEARCERYARGKRAAERRRRPAVSSAHLDELYQAELGECRVKERIALEYESVVVAEAPTDAATAGRARSEVTRREMRERLPRSAPDALRYEPGVYVQQTAHSQASPYIRGVTGQQTLLVFDGIRLNNSIYRQGPNQYFFTVDSRSVSSIEVVRGSASVLHGSDALGGAILAHPVEPALREDVEGLRLTPRTYLRTTTADDEVGGRFEVDAQLGEEVGFVGGAGYRTVGLLESGGRIEDSVTSYYSGGARVTVPEFAEDGRTQLGTGFDEGTWDGRLVYRLSSDTRAILALYGYRQYDAPRTDKCPPPYEPVGNCLTFEEQFRTLGYLALEGPAGPLAATARLSTSYQRHHERRRMDRPESLMDPRYWRDDVDTIGLQLQATSEHVHLGRPAMARLLWGGDAYQDTVASVAWYQIDTDRIHVLRYWSRGQYLDNSLYRQVGFYGQPEVTLWKRLTLRAGGRFAAVEARAPEDPDTGSSAVDQSWTAVVGRAGAAVEALPWLTIVANADQGFRAPNLDDLTSRQQTGPGFQFENPDLEPERSLTLETGSIVDLGRVSLSAWVYRMTIEGAMARRRADADDCPPETPECAGSWLAYQLVNLDGTAQVVGAEGTALLQLPFGFGVRATVAWARGDGPNPAERPTDPDAHYEERVPLSRIAPLNGTVEAVWRARRGPWAGVGLRWAAEQDRLAPQDHGDARIFLGGTPAFAVIDLRAGFRLGRKLALGLVLENVFDAAYRYHGSSVNGPGRGLVLSAEIGL